MDSEKQKRLEIKGWKVGNVDDLLELTPEEFAIIELQLALSRSLNK